MSPIRKQPRATSISIMSFVGKYERTSAENYDEFLAGLGVNFLLRKAATVSTPVMEVNTF